MIINHMWNLISLAALGVILSSLLGFMGRAWWVFDLFSHFRVQYCVLSTLLVVLFLVGGKYPQGMACAVVALLNLGLIAPVYRRTPPHFHAVLSDRRESNPGPAGTSVYRVLLANVLQPNRDYLRVQELICSTEPDLILLIEINHAWVDMLQPALKNYPYTLTALREDHYGLGLFSKRPLTSAQSLAFGPKKIPSLLARLPLDGQMLTIAGTHPPPPKRAIMAFQRDAQLKEIAQFLAGQPGPAMLLGDLNITPWSPHFREMLRLGKLKDSRQGWGLHPSWPVDRPPLLVPIDHVLVTEGIAVHRRWRGPFIGSDHAPIFVEFSLYPISPSN